MTWVKVMLLSMEMIIFGKVMFVRCDIPDKLIASNRGLKFLIQCGIKIPSLLEQRFNFPQLCRNLHFAGSPHKIIIIKRRPHNFENIQSFVLQINDKPFAS